VLTLAFKGAEILVCWVSSQTPADLPRYFERELVWVDFWIADQAFLVVRYTTCAKALTLDQTAVEERMQAFSFRIARVNGAGELVRCTNTVGGTVRPIGFIGLGIAPLALVDGVERSGVEDLAVDFAVAALSALAFARAIAQVLQARALGAKARGSLDGVDIVI